MLALARDLEAACWWSQKKAEVGKELLPADVLRRILLTATCHDELLRHAATCAKVCTAWRAALLPCVVYAGTSGAQKQMIEARLRRITDPYTGSLDWALAVQMLHFAPERRRPTQFSIPQFTPTSDHPNVGDVFKENARAGRRPNGADRWEAKGGKKSLVQSGQMPHPGNPEVSVIVRRRYGIMNYGDSLTQGLAMSFHQYTWSMCPPGQVGDQELPERLFHLIKHRAVHRPEAPCTGPATAAAAAGGGGSAATPMPNLGRGPGEAGAQGHHVGVGILDLARLNLGDAGVHAAAAALAARAQPLRIHTLLLGSNLMSLASIPNDTTSPDMLALLRTSPSLRQSLQALDLSDNPWIGDAGVARLATSLPPSLTRLTIAHTGCGDGGLNALAIAATESRIPKLCYLDCTRNPTIGAVGLQEMSNAVDAGHLPNLREVHNDVFCCRLGVRAGGDFVAGTPHPPNT